MSSGLLPPRCAPLPPRGRGRPLRGRFFERDRRGRSIRRPGLPRLGAVDRRAASTPRASSQRPTVWRRSLRRCEKPTVTSSRSSAGSTSSRDRQRRHPQHRRVDARRRLERFGRHVEQRLDPVAPLQHHGEPAVVLVAGLGGDPVDDLLLQHEVLVLDGVARLEEMEQDRRRDVVGQVADDAKLPPRRRGGQAPRSRRRARRPRSPRGPACGAVARRGRDRAR